jgi:putative sigma-54 modulation protein
MNIIIKATQTTLTDSITNAIHEKLEPLEKFLKPEDKVHVEVDAESKHVSGEVYRAEIIIQPHGYYAEAGGSDFYEALDKVVPKIKQQLIKEKDKQISERRQSPGLDEIV